MGNPIVIHAHEVGYVNIHGQPISEAAMQAQRDIAKQQAKGVGND